jgi:hypothetical protein
MSHLNTAFTIGALTAQEEFNKIAEGEVLTPLMGGVPGYGPALAGVAGGVTAPEGKGIAAAGRSAGGSLLGQLLGGAGGAAGGAGLGAGGAALYNKLTGSDVNVGGAGAIGAGLGGLLGTMGGGALGAHKGREKALGRTADKDKE